MKLFNRKRIYQQKKQWKILLLFFAAVIVFASLWFSNVLVKRIAQVERNRIHTWADAVQHRANLVNASEPFFSEIQNEERKRIELYAEAIKHYPSMMGSEESKLVDMIIEGNTNIPAILTDTTGRISSAVNVDFSLDTTPVMTPQLLKDFGVYEPFKFEYWHKQYNYIYYKDSKVFGNAKKGMEDLVNSFFRDIVNNSASVPVLVTDSLQTTVIASGNIDSSFFHNQDSLQRLIREMKSQNDPIVIDLAHRGINYIYYKDSNTLTQLRYFPYFQFGIIGVFLFIAYLLFSTSRRSEQNQVWAGLAKETAHQLGTPLSSMMAWIDYLEMKGIEAETIEELRKDVDRLQVITERFSKIGSAPVLKPENITVLIYNAVDYLKKRTSQKIRFHVNPSIDEAIIVPLNYQLFDWVIENLIKNAVDAVGSKGDIFVLLTNEGKQVIVDVTDNGKGIPRNLVKTVFKPGFSSKLRGWGLGLSLSKRIINDYHRGKIFVKQSVVGKGTTFRIVLQK